MRKHNLIIAAGGIVVIGALLLFVVLQKRVGEEWIPLPRTIPDKTSPIEQKEEPIVGPEGDIESGEQEVDTIEDKQETKATEGSSPLGDGTSGKPDASEEAFREQKNEVKEEARITQAEGGGTEDTSRRKTRSDFPVAE